MPDWNVGPVFTVRHPTCMLEHLGRSAETRRNKKNKNHGLSGCLAKVREMRSLIARGLADHRVDSEKFLN